MSVGQLGTTPHASTGTVERQSNLNKQGRLYTSRTPPAGIAHHRALDPPTPTRPNKKASTQYEQRTCPEGPLVGLIRPAAASIVPQHHHLITMLDHKLVTTSPVKHPAMKLLLHTHTTQQAHVSTVHKPHACKCALLPISR